MHLLLPSAVFKVSVTAPLNSVACNVELPLQGFYPHLMRSESRFFARAVGASFMLGGDMADISSMVGALAGARFGFRDIQANFVKQARRQHRCTVIHLF